MFDNKKEIRILNAHKNVRKIFKSVEEAKAYIIDKKLHNSVIDIPISLEVTYKEYETVNIEIPKLSLDIKKRLIEILRKNSDGIDSKISLYGVLYDVYMRNKTDNVNIWLAELIKQKLNYTDLELDLIFNNENIITDEKDKIYNTLEKLQKSGEFNINKFELIEKVLEDVEVSEIDFKFVYTNYKACNNINFDIGENTFQIRVDDIRFNEGWVTGRNVNMTKTSDLTDLVFNDFIKKTKWYEA